MLHKAPDCATACKSTHSLSKKILKITQQCLVEKQPNFKNQQNCRNLGCLSQETDVLQKPGRDHLQAFLFFAFSQALKQLEASCLNIPSHPKCTRTHDSCRTPAVLLTANMELAKNSPFDFPPQKNATGAGLKRCRNKCNTCAPA